MARHDGPPFHPSDSPDEAPRPDHGVAPDPMALSTAVTSLDLLPCAAPTGRWLRPHPSALVSRGAGATIDKYETFRLLSTRPSTWRCIFRITAVILLVREIFYKRRDVSSSLVPRRLLVISYQDACLAVLHSAPSRWTLRSSRPVGDRAGSMVGTWHDDGVPRAGGGAGQGIDAMRFGNDRDGAHAMSRWVRNEFSASKDSLLPDRSTAR